MRKLPTRPTNEITQQFNAGIVKVYSVQDVAQPGRKPVEGLALTVTLRYEEMRLGINRYYSGRQNQVEIERVIRTPRNRSVSSQDVVIAEDGKQYRIDMVQSVSGVWPACMDLTLAKIEQEFEVPE